MWNILQFIVVIYPLIIIFQGLQEKMMDEMEACGVSDVNIREPDPHSKRNQIEIAQTLG